MPGDSDSVIWDRSGLMVIHISQRNEARLTEEARRLGITVDELVEQLINERAAGAVRRGSPELPVWHLGSVGSLHRRDIYDDVR